MPARRDALPAGREQLRRNSALIASVACFPERGGSWLLKLAGDILNYRLTPPAVFVRHPLLTARNVDQYYPDDQLVFG